MSFIPSTTATPTISKSSDIYTKDLRIEFASKCEEGLNASCIDHLTRCIIRQAAGHTLRNRPYELLMSHRGMRKFAARLLYRELRRLFAEPGRRWFFGTFIADVGNALEYAPVVEAGRLKREVWKMLDFIDMHAIGVVEIQAARYPLRGAGRTFQAHIHTIGYTCDEDFSAAAAQKKIGSRTTLSNWLGAPVAVLKPILSRDDLKSRCDYIFKAPLQEVHLRSDKRKRSGFATHARGKVNAWGALRLIEILSHFSLRSATMSRGQLVKNKGNWIRAVKSWTEEHPAREEWDYAAAFEQLWSNCPTRRRRATPVIRYDNKQPPDPSWTASMADRLAAVAAHQLRFDVRQSERRDSRRRGRSR